MVTPLLGGIGIFLLGMVLLTDGLKALAGEALRRILTRYVATPTSGVGWGALLTALVQSSSATTLATVGFVSAGLLTFAQAIGVVFGANLGTTSTGWIVSQLGLKISLGSIAPPLVLVGVVLRLLFKGRAAHVGTAIAGFALLFMGIDLLQHGMEALSSRLTPSDLPGGEGAVGWRARLLLAGFGFLMTVIMQSSSASMTATLTALASGTIGLEQAAALVIGQNIGTTPTAVAAAFGAPTAAKRTALAHVLFNILTGAVAIAILPWLLGACSWIAESLGSGDSPTALALFHTLFNVLGVAMLLPAIKPFARMIEGIFPERGARSTRYLASSVAFVGPVALEAARRATVQVLAGLAGAALASIGEARGHRNGRRASAPVPDLDDATLDLQEIVRFLQHLGQSAQAPIERTREQSLFHAIDHLKRTISALRAPPTRASMQIADAMLSLPREQVVALAKLLATELEVGDEHSANPAETLRDLATHSARIAGEIAVIRKSARQAALGEAAAGLLDAGIAMERVDTLLWLDRLAYHLARAAYHLQQNPNGPDESDSPDSPAIDHTEPGAHP